MGFCLVFQKKCPELRRSVWSSIFKKKTFDNHVKMSHRSEGCTWHQAQSFCIGIPPRSEHICKIPLTMDCPLPLSSNTNCLLPLQTLTYLNQTVPSTFVCGGLYIQPVFHITFVSRNTTKGHFLEQKKQGEVCPWELSEDGTMQWRSGIADVEQMCWYGGTGIQEVVKYWHTNFKNWVVALTVPIKAALVPLNLSSFLYFASS